MRLCRWKTGHKKLVGVFGTRLAGKTFACLNAICDHLWRVKNARFLVLVRTQGSGTTSGVWNELTEKILPSWFEADGIAPDKPELHMAWGPKGEPRANVSKKMIASVTNMHGGVSKLELDSLDDEREVEDKFKNRYYTGILWCEAGEFKQAKTFLTLMLALRSSGVDEQDFLMLVDANPPDEGQDHFLFKYFYELRVSSEPNIEEKAIQECLHVTEWTMEDNPYISENEKNAVKGAYATDPDLYDRYIRGMWKRAVRDALFADIFKPAVHVLGGPAKEGPELILMPSDNCVELITGHDAGGVNPISHILEQIVYITTERDRDGREREKPVSMFQYLDELAFIGGDISPAEFTRLMMDKMDYWEQELQRPIEWYHYADLSALNFKESIAQRTVADEMFAESDGRIRLIGVEKKPGSVAMRIRLLRRLLSENRIKISGSKCPKLIEMFQCIRRGKTDGTVATHSTHKHAMDSCSYPLVQLCWNELQTMVRSVQSQREPESRLVTVGL